MLLPVGALAVPAAVLDEAAAAAARHFRFGPLAVGAGAGVVVGGGLLLQGHGFGRLLSFFERALFALRVRDAIRLSLVVVVEEV